MSRTGTIDEKVLHPVVERTDAPWGLFAALGVLMVAVGIAAMLFPFTATLATEIVVGAALIAAGACQLVQAFSRSGWKGRALTGLGAVLSLAAGLLLLAFPLSGMVTLTIVVGAYFLVTGVFRVALAFRIRPEESWGWMALSGALALALAILVAIQLPQVAGWLLGLLVGIDLLFAGWWALLVGLAQRRASREV